jgi:transcription antitermination factor NusB
MDFYLGEGEHRSPKQAFEYYAANFAKEVTGGGISEPDYVLRVFAWTYANHEEIDKLIAKTSDSWDFARISKIDLAIMRLAVYEILHEEEIAQSVSINEAVELAKEFSTEEASKFVNGILGKIARGLSASDSSVLSEGFDGS